ncbi:hypothetical protein G5714_004436 [Onychostoma macrolepis]|uniref:Uncharacterized protein n=1 Tax=Onychostoma macrolepis TaxID=369639 RepID=A0A7J6D4P1_9TELE|nr:hypothetical protein G5714_004436 [Onychostoma macrolepis]
MSVSLEELCQMVIVPYDQARALIESESSDGESVVRERGSNSDFSGGLEGEEASLLAPEQVQFDTVFHGGSEEDLDAENSCSDAEEDAPPRKRLRAENTWKKVINKKRRMVGKSYVGKQKQKEIMREPRATGPRCSSAACAKSAKHHCSAIDIFNDFWQHMTWEEKRVYVHALIDVVLVQRRRGAENSRRSNSLLLFFSGQRAEKTHLQSGRPCIHSQLFAGPPQGALTLLQIHNIQTVSQLSMISEPSGTTTMERWTSKSTTLMTGIHIRVTNSSDSPLCSDRLKIKELKFKHLQDLKEVIPKDFHSFYDNLLH